MTRNVSRKLVVALCLALVACLSVMASTAFAYYTDTSKANGMIAFSWTPDNPGNPDNPGTPDDPDVPDVPDDPDEPKTDVEEELHGLDKSITVKNTGDVDALVRVQLIYPDPAHMAGGVTIEVQPGEGWMKDGDWYYYTSPVKPGESTDTSIKVSVNVQDKSKLRPFDIVVIQQCAKVEYNAEKQLHGTFAMSEGLVAIPGVVDETQGAGE